LNGCSNAGSDDRLQKPCPCGTSDTGQCCLRLLPAGRIQALQSVASARQAASVPSRPRTMRKRRGSACCAVPRTPTVRICPEPTSHQRVTGSGPVARAQPLGHAPSMASLASATGVAPPVALHTDSLQLNTVTIASRNEGWDPHQTRSAGESQRRAARSTAAGARCSNVLGSARSIPTPPALGDRAAPPSKGVQDGRE
jgi:hypothetical protein